MKYLARAGFLGAAAFLAGCGGGTPNLLAAENEAVRAFGGADGSLTTRIAGTAQAPVVSGGPGAVITGVAGGLVSSLIYHRANATQAETRIAFQSNRAGGNYAIYTMAATGGAESDVRRLTEPTFANEFPAWSPGGDKIAFSSTRDSNPEIYVMNADGTSQQRLTNNNATDYFPSWSPDGGKIAFTSLRDGDAEIYVMNADGSGVTKLTDNTFSDDGAVWSPDGTKIAFQSNRLDNNFEIYVMDANGTNLQRLTFATSTDSDISWSPDGTKIAFTSRRNDNYEIYVMNADGTNQQRLTTNTVEDSGPSWSADGSKIIFTTLRDGNYELYTINPDGSEPTPKTANANIDIWPRWSPLLKKRELIGANGQFGTAAAGFLFGQNGDTIISVVAFDTSTEKRINARVAALTGVTAGLSNYVFNITASDALTRLAYTNGYYSAPQSVISGNVSAIGAIVSFNSTGQVSSVLPYAANRSSGAPKASVENGVQILRGQFLSAWDGAGKNLAPQGATEVRLNVHNGALVSVK